MARDLTAAAKKALFAQQTEQVFLVLLEISHVDLPAPIRVVNNTEQVIQDEGGPAEKTFSPFPFEIILPPENAEEIAPARLRIDNIDRGIAISLRSISTAPTVTLWVVMASAPDNVQVGPQEFAWRVAKWDAFTVEGDLVFGEWLRECYPGDRFIPSLFPGAF